MAHVDKSIFNPTSKNSLTVKATFSKIAGLPHHLRCAEVVKGWFAEAAMQGKQYVRQLGLTA